MAKVAFLKLQYFGHVTRGSAGQLALTVLEGTVEGKPANDTKGSLEDSGWMTSSNGWERST